MFTGIVETVGRVISLEHGAESSRVVVDAPEIVASVALGDSISVGGACLTQAVCDGEISIESPRDGTTSTDATIDISISMLLFVIVHIIFSHEPHARYTTCQSDIARVRFNESTSSRAFSEI